MKYSKVTDAQSKVSYNACGKVLKCGSVIFENGIEVSHFLWETRFVIIGFLQTIEVNKIINKSQNDCEFKKSNKKL